MKVDQWVAIRCIKPNQIITDISFELTAENYTLDEPLNITAHLKIMKKNSCGGIHNLSLNAHDYEKRSIRILVCDDTFFRFYFNFYQIILNYFF